MTNRKKFPFVCQECGNTGGTSHKGMCQKCYNTYYYNNNKQKFIDCAAKWRNNNIEKSRECARIWARKKWASLTKEEKLLISREQEKKRGKEEKAKRRIYAVNYYRNHKDKWGKRGSDKPCIVCGKIDDKTKYISGKCKACYSKILYKEKHPKQIKFCVICKKQIGSYSKLEKCMACRNKERYQNDPVYREKMLAKNIKNNKSASAKEKKRIACIRRRTKVANLEFSLTKDEWHNILEKFNHRCAYCGKDGKLEMDHVIPITGGGPTTKDNIVPACRSCNSKKRNTVGIFIPKIYDDTIT